MKTLITDEILGIEQSFLENGDIENFQSNFPLKTGDVVITYSNDGEYEEMSICLVDEVYPDVIEGIFLDSIYKSSENYYADNSEGDWKEIINQYFDCELEGGEKYFSKDEGIWEKFQSAKDKKEFIRNLMEEA